MELYSRWTQFPLTGLRKLGYRPWGFSILFSTFLIFITWIGGHRGGVVSGRGGRGLTSQASDLH